MNLKKFHQIILDWSPYLVLAFFYQNIHYLADFWQIKSFDWLLTAIDRWLFWGQLPTLMIQSWNNYWLTEWFSLIYLLYLPLLIVAPLYFYLHNKQLYRKITILICLTSIIGLTGYIILPAVGPDSYLSDKFIQSIIGGPIFKLENFIISLVRAPRDTFPSMHVAHTAVILFFCWRRKRFIFWWLLPFVLSVWLSTMYLRYHYFIDVLSGVAVALLAYWLYLKLIQNVNIKNKN
ncbi:MAG: phosphatase PAP2 family protein [Candidatus Buchananbacteria bacterium]